MKYFKFSDKIIYLIFVLTSCGNPVHDGKIEKLSYNKDIVLINLDEAKNESDTFLYSSIFTNVEMIYLDSNDINSLIGVVHKIHATDNFIFILDIEKTKTIHVFNKKGQFLRTIGKIGSGPGELTQPYDFTIDEERNELYILDSAKQTVSKYDILSGNLILTFSVNSNTTIRSFHIQYHEGSLFLDIFSKEKKDKYLLQQINSITGKQESKFLESEEIIAGWDKGLMIQQSIFYSNGKFFRFTERFMTTVIGIDKNEVYPVVELNSKNIFTQEELSSFSKMAHKTMNDIYNVNKISNITNYVENDNFIWFSYLIGREFRNVFYDKKTKKNILIDYLKDDLLLENKLSYSFAESQFGCSTKNGVYFYVNTFSVDRLKEGIDNGFFPQDIKGIKEIKEMSTIDNPIILFYKFN